MFQCLLSPICRRVRYFHVNQFHPCKISSQTSSYVTRASPQVCQSSKSSNKDTIASSTIVVQDGLNFSELPLAIKQTKSLLPDAENKREEIISCCDEPNTTNHDAIKEKLETCTDLDKIFNFLEDIPSAEVSPHIASHALKCIADLCKNFEYRNAGLKVPDQSNINTFTRKAVFSKLFETTCVSNDINIVLTGLSAALRIDHGSDGEAFLSDKFISECLLRICDGKATIVEISKFAGLVALASSNYAQVLDQLWSPISDKSAEIDSSNLAKLYRLLPMLKHSRGHMFRILEKRTYSCWWQLTISDIEEILSILVKINFRPQNLLLSLSKWVHLHIHTLSEIELKRIVSCYEKLDYTHHNLKNAIERYVKFRNVNIKNADLVVAIMNYCLHFKLQANVILDSVARYFVAHASEITPTQIGCIAKPFGVLNYVPEPELMFYKILEDVVMDKFVEFRPEDLIELLLTCTYVQRYPLNFVKKIFNSFFLERLSSIEDRVMLQNARTNLRLLDMAMTIECRRYRGPLLPWEQPLQVLQRDGRLTKLINRLADVMSEMFGGYHYFLNNKWLQNYPLSEMYIIDFIIHVHRDGHVMPVDEKAKLGKRKAVVILMPEHFCYGSKCLIGKQSSKIRQLQRLGYEVILLDFEEVNILYSSPHDLSLYLKQKLLI